MAVDDGLLSDARRVTVRRYRWSPPTLSLGKFQRLPAATAETAGTAEAAAAAEAAETVARAGAERMAAPTAPSVRSALHERMAHGGVPVAEAAITGLPFDVARRPSGGRAVLHGADFEWSFAAAFPPAASDRSGCSIGAAYEVVSAAMADALRACGVPLAGEREEPYRRSALCFATSLRHDLHVAVGKVVAVAQVRRNRATLVHGSVLERRPPRELTEAVERLVGEPWRGDGLQAAGEVVDPDELWLGFVDALRLRLA